MIDQTMYFSDILLLYICHVYQHRRRRRSNITGSFTSFLCFSFFSFSISQNFHFSSSPFVIMGRETRDPAALGSSIALLQERFRQLERAREQREVRELKLFFEPQVIMCPMKSFVAAKKPVFVQESGVVSLGESDDRDLLKLGLNLSSRHADFQAIKKRALWWGDERRSVSTAWKKMESSDVDTSLHL